jgi:hypothetical protein
MGGNESSKHLEPYVSIPSPFSKASEKLKKELIKHLEGMDA